MSQFHKLTDFEVLARKEPVDTDSVFNELLMDRAIGVFDFDGVVISRSEEAVYQLPEFEGEREKLELLARKLNFPTFGYGTRYLRHIVFQFALEEVHIPPTPGPFIKMLKRLKSSGRTFFILTARSAPPAIRRAMSFLSEYDILPCEVFFVGRVGKGRQLELLGKELSGKRILYFDDSIRHYSNAERMKGSIESFHVAWTSEELGSASDFYRDTLRSAFKVEI